MGHRTKARLRRQITGRFAGQQDQNSAEPAQLEIKISGCRVVIQVLNGSKRGEEPGCVNICRVYLNKLRLALVKLFPFLCIKLLTIPPTRLCSAICVCGPLTGVRRKWQHPRQPTVRVCMGHLQGTNLLFQRAWSSPACLAAAQIS